MPRAVMPGRAFRAGHWNAHGIAESSEETSERIPCRSSARSPITEHRFIDVLCWYLVGVVLALGFCALIFSADLLAYLIGPRP